MDKKVVVLRYGHRTVRDYRVTTHCCLVARAFGAEKIVVNGEEDESISKSVGQLTEKFGGNFKVEFTKNWRKELESFKKDGYIIIHLTMYGENIEDMTKTLIKCNKIAVLIGSQKVEKAVYELCDYNISVTNQPHSEIAALTVFLDRVFEGRELKPKKGGKIEILASKKDKKVIYND